MARKPNQQWINEVWAEMARRKKRFHPDEEWQDIRLWGLFRWGQIRWFFDEGLLTTHMKKEHKIVWVRPTEKAYHEHIEPLLDKSLDELTTLAGWVLEGPC